MLRRLATAGGTILVAVSLYFVFARLWEQRDKLGDWHPQPALLYSAVAGILVYALACFFLSGNWERLLRLFGHDRFDSTIARSIYARSQLVKYVPGNILHIASRHIMARNLGLGDAPLAMAALYEIAGLLAAAASLGLLGAALFGVGEDRFGGVETSLLLFIATAVAFFAGHRIIGIILTRYAPGHNLPPGQTVKGLLVVYGGYLGFFLLAGLILLTLVFSFSHVSGFSGIAVVLISFALSWTAGFLTPGAPSGIGIREAIIVITLERLVASEEALIIAVLFRVITVMGDLLFMAIAVAGAHRQEVRKS